jgi:hypothetical protein
MKSLKNYIAEALKINSKSRIVKTNQISLFEFAEKLFHLFRLSDEYSLKLTEVFPHLPKCPKTIEKRFNYKNAYIFDIEPAFDDETDEYIIKVCLDVIGQPFKKFFWCVNDELFNEVFNKEQIEKLYDYIVEKYKFYNK